MGESRLRDWAEALVEIFGPLSESDFLFKLEIRKAGAEVDCETGLRRWWKFLDHFLFKLGLRKAGGKIDCETGLRRWWKFLDHFWPEVFLRLTEVG